MGNEFCEGYIVKLIFQMPQSSLRVVETAPSRLIVTGKTTVEKIQSKNRLE